MKKFLNKPAKAGKAFHGISSIILLLLMCLASTTPYAQTIGIVQGLTAVSPRAGQPSPVNGWPTVEFPVLITPPGQVYVNRFYKFDNAGKLVDMGGVPKGYDTSNHGWTGYCVQCTVGDIPQLYRAVTLNCPTGSAGPWSPDPYADPTLSVQTNPCSGSTAWSDPLTWYDYKAPTSQTGAYDINRNVTLDVNFTADSKAITCNNNSTITINGGVTFTSINCGGGARWVINGSLNGVGGYATVVNNGVLSPGANGIAQFQGGQYTQSAGGTLNMQIGSTSSFDKLYFTSGANVLAGTLKVSLVNGFVPSVNNSFNIIERSYATYSGTFSNLILPALPAGLKWKISYNPTAVTLTVIDCSTLAASFSKTDATCFNSATGTISANITGGTQPFKYNSGAPPTATYQLGNVFSGLRSNNYRIYYEDAVGCAGYSPLINIAQPTAIGTTFTQKDACGTSASASITVTATGGTPPYQYKNGSGGAYQSSNTFNNLISANYRIYVKDANGCMGNTPLINVGSTPTFSTAFTKKDACNGVSSATGSITVILTGGTPPFLYKNGANGTYQSSNVFNNLIPNNYRIYMQDAAGCTGYTPLITIGQFAPVTATFTQVNASCINAADGSIMVTGTGGTAPYLYKNGVPGLYQSSNVFNGLRANNYRIYLKDVNGCTGNTALVTIAPGTAPCFAASTMQKTERTPLETYKQLSISLFPNPGVGQFALVAHSANLSSVSIRVVDVNGKVLYNAKGNAEQPFRFGSEFAPGIYLVEVRQGERVKTVKAVKMR